MGRPRQQKNLNELRRKRGVVDPAPAVLIVCEGQKTEPNYFSAFVQSLHLPTVDVIPACGSAPASVVADAAKRKKDRAKEARRSLTRVPYKYVYCVFDVDEHLNIPSALETARENKIRVALSNPCFEYWLLLHFGRFGSTGLTRDRAQRELKKRLNEFEKGGNYGPVWLEKAPQAIRCAEEHHRAQWQIDPSDPTKILECCPSTGVHLLVKLLYEIAKT